MGLFVECGVVELVQKIWRTCESGKLLKQNKDLPLHVETSINVGYYLDCPCRYLLRVFSYEIMFKHFLYNVVILFYCKNIWKREWYLSDILFNTTMENHILGFFYAAILNSIIFFPIIIMAEFGEMMTVNFWTLIR